LMAGTDTGQAVQVTGQATSVMPKSNATPDMLKAASAVAPAQSTIAPTFGDGPAPGPLGPGPGCNLFPALASTGASVPLSYFGPPPSAGNPSMVGPYQLLQSGHVDAAKGTLTLPLYKGYMKNGNVPVWYILTDVSDPTVATLLGLNPSAKLTNAGPGARTANFNSNGDLIFDAGAVDFSPERALVSGSSSAPFPPAVSRPGSIGDANYSPLVRVLNAGGIFYNAPIVANGVEANDINFPNGNVDYHKVHDQVLAIDPFNQTVTLQLINGFSFGRPLWYISLDASTQMVAAIEGNTYAPLMQNLVTGKDDSCSSPVERIFIATNGSTDCANPQRLKLLLSCDRRLRSGSCEELWRELCAAIGECVEGHSESGVRQHLRRHKLQAVQCTALVSKSCRTKQCRPELHSVVGDNPSDLEDHTSCAAVRS
jgi:hypothetical protein